MKGLDKDRFKTKLLDLAKQNWFRFMPQLPRLWDTDKALIQFGEMKSFDGHPRSVKCSATFDEYLDELTPRPIAGPRDPLLALKKILEAVAPGSPAYVFNKQRRFHRLLHLSDYVLDNAFVSCVWAISRWLGIKIFPQGVFAWPPEVPPSVLPKPAPIAGIPEREPLAALADGDGGFPAMSSNGTF